MRVYTSNMSSRGELDRLFIYHDMRPVEQQQRIGEYVTGMFPNHISLGVIHTANLADVCNAIESVVDEYDPIPLVRGDMFLTGGRGDHRKPAIHIKDPTNNLHRMQLEMLRAAALVPDTEVARRAHFSQSRSPHVSVSYLESGQAPRVPREFELGRVSVTLSNWDHFIRNRTQLMVSHADLRQPAYESAA